MQNFLSYQEVGKSQLKWEKIFNKCQYPDDTTQILEIKENNFKPLFTTTLQQAIMSTLEKKIQECKDLSKKEKIQEPNGNFKIEKYNNKIKKILMSSIAEWWWQQRGS